MWWYVWCGVEVWFEAVDGGVWLMVDDAGGRWW